MAQLLARASALPCASPALPPSPFRHLVRHAAERPDAVASLVRTDGGTRRSRTWEELRLEVERAAAGLLRHGLRPDQVVVSLVRSDHSLLVELAVRATGAVLVRPAPGARRTALMRALGDADVRFVIADADSDVERLGPLPARAEALVLGDGEGWSDLQQYGAERLVMDPDAVTRMEAMVAPEDTVPRLIATSHRRRRTSCVSPVPPELSEQLSSHDVLLVAGSPRDPFLAQVVEAQLAAGAAVAFVPRGADLGAVLAAVRPTVVALDETSARALERQVGDSIADAPWAINLDRALEALELDRALDPRLRRAFRVQVRNLVQVTPWFGGRMERVLCANAPDSLQRLLRALRVDLPGVGAPALVSMPLPVVPVPTSGDPSLLVRRRRSDPPASFSLAVVG